MSKMGYRAFKNKVLSLIFIFTFTFLLYFLFIYLFIYLFIDNHLFFNEFPFLFIFLPAPYARNYINTLKYNLFFFIFVVFFYKKKKSFSVSIYKIAI